MSNEASQRHTDEQRRLHDIRVENRQRFATPLGRDLFAMGVENLEGFQARPVLSREEAERNVRAAIIDEQRTEGRAHVNIRPQRHE